MYCEHRAKKPESGRDCFPWIGCWNRPWPSTSASSSDSDAAGEQQCHVILQLFRPGPLPDTLDHDAHNLFLAEVCVAHQQFEKTLFAEHFSIRVFRLGETVGEENQQIIHLQGDAALAIFGERESAHHGSIHVQPLNRATTHQYRRQMSAVGVTEGAGSLVEEAQAPVSYTHLTLP